MQLAGILEPLDVKGLEFKNRIVMPPMYTGLATSEGAVTEELIEHYVQRSRALGLIIIEHSFVVREGRLGQRQLGCDNDSSITGLERLSSSIHASGVPVVLQINHAGRSADPNITGSQPVGPSPNGTVRELKVDEIKKIVRRFAEGAERAMRAGFDGAEIHGAHGFLLNQFLSPLTNHRTDQYGGSLENRIRFPLEVVEEVRAKVGGRLLLYRLGSDDLDPQGIHIKQSQKFAVKLEEAGIDIIDVSGGLCGSRPPELQDVQGYFVPQAQKIKEVVEVPVIGVGGIEDPEYADELILEGKVDLVAVGRSLFKDSEWAKKAIQKLRGR